MINEIDKLKDNLSTSENSIYRTEYNETYDFFIDTNSAIYIQNGEYHSYTFAILKDITNPLILKNLLLSVRENGSYKAFLMTYNVTEEERNKILEGEFIDLTDRATVESLDDEFINLINPNARDIEFNGGLWYNSDLNYCYVYNPQIDSATGTININIQEEVTCPWDQNPQIQSGDSTNNDGSSGNSGSNNTGGNTGGSGNTSGGGTNGSGSQTGGNDASDGNSSDSDSDSGAPDDNCISEDGSCMPDATAPIDTEICRPNAAVANLIDSLPDSEFKTEANNYFALNLNSCSAQEFLQLAVDAHEDGGEVDFEDKVINKLTGKAKCIFDKLKTNSMGFKNAIKLFDGDFPVSHLTFSIDNSLSDGNYGITYPPQNFNTKIDMSNAQLSNISDLGSAVAFIHEVIHAEIFRKMLSAAKMGSLDPENMTQAQQVAYVESLRTNFPGIYDYYLARYRPNWNHNLMAQHYITTIADMVQEFDGSSKTREVYESLAWAGLKSIENFENSIAWDNLTSDQQNTIQNNINNYFHNGISNCN